MAAGKNTKCQIGALMMSAVVALGVRALSSTAKAQDDASRFTYVRLHCTPDNQSHFTDVTIELAKENFAPPAAPIAIGGNKPTSRAFIAGFGAHWGAADLQTHLNHPTPAVQLFTVLRGVFSITVTDGETRQPVTWSCWKTSHLAEDTLLSWATNPDSYSSLADYAEPAGSRIKLLA